MSKGHHPDGSGVQRHSAGANYPFITMVRGNKCIVMHPDGHEEPVSELTVNDRADRIACIGAAMNHAYWRASERRTLGVLVRRDATKGVEK